MDISDSNSSLKNFALLFLLVTFWINLPAYADDGLRISRPQKTSSQTDPKPAPQRPSPSTSSRPKLTVNIPEENQPAPSGGLTQVELQRLAAHDIVLLVDKSGSMHTTDCPITGLGKLGIVSSLMFNGPGGVSRWDWCLEQTSRMAKQTEKALPDGFSVLLFDERFAVYPKVNVEELAKIFRHNVPSGGTVLSQPLASTFADYFRRKSMANNRVKPLLVGIITDGCPNDAEETLAAIVGATHSMRNPKEISVIFFLIGGHDRRGEDFVYEASHELTAHGGAFNIVQGVPFPELEKTGLARALADHLD